MSAFNKARYNLARYNVEAGGQTWLQGAAQVTFGFSFAGMTYYGYGNSRVSFVSDDLQADRGRMMRGSTSITFAETDCSVIGYFNLIVTYINTCTAALNLSQIVSAAGSTIENFDAALNLSQIISADGTGAASYDAERMTLSQNVWSTADFGEVFNATADVMALTEYVCEFPDLILRPGQTLVIDAGTYNVLLDGDNAIHLQQGDWLDSMKRNTQTITISGTGASRLTAEILYTERYL